MLIHKQVESIFLMSLNYLLKLVSPDSNHWLAFWSGWSLLWSRSLQTDRRPSETTGKCHGPSSRDWSSTPTDAQAATSNLPEASSSDWKVHRSELHHRTRCHFHLQSKAWVSWRVSVAVLAECKVAGSSPTEVAAARGPSEGPSDPWRLLQSSWSRGQSSASAAAARWAGPAVRWSDKAVGQLRTGAGLRAAGLVPHSHLGDDVNSWRNVVDQVLWHTVTWMWRSVVAKQERRCGTETLGSGRLEVPWGHHVVAPSQVGLYPEAPLVPSSCPCRLRTQSAATKKTDPSLKV